MSAETVRAKAAAARPPLGAPTTRPLLWQSAVDANAAAAATVRLLIPAPTFGAGGLVG